jgi:hypothetical protein
MLSVSSYFACLIGRRQTETTFLMFLAAPPPLPAYANEDVIRLEV